MRLIGLKNKIVPVMADLVAIPLAWYAAYWLRFNLGAIPLDTLLHAAYALPFLCAIQTGAFWFFGLYRGIWRFASLPDLVRIIKAVLVGVLISLIPIFLFSLQIPRSVIFIYGWFLITLLAGARFIARALKDYPIMAQQGKRVLIVGAGVAAESLLRELSKGSEKFSYRPIALVDDDSAKIGCEIHGVRVVGLTSDIPKIVSKYNIEMVAIAIPTAKAAKVREIVAYCEEAEVSCTTIPSLNDIVSGRANINALREIALEDLLGRDPVTLDWENISNTIRGKKILVSGGGGSIGSELCRQIAFLAPQELIIIDHSEFNLYSIDEELRQKFAHLKLECRLVDVADKIAVDKVIKELAPDLIFHAAAYKHVPLLEHQIRAAMRNNIIGTYNLASAATLHEVPTFVLVSTDKAVNPANIMGATKRAAEVVCKDFNGKARTHFITVRFGNVLGSAGSVVPLFKKQLEQNLPLTVTHPEVTRYFMTIPEAAQLILQATTLGSGGEIFVLDMGEPIKIKFLAEQMIHLAGRKLGEDASIVYIGLRPGEKLYEELFYASENMAPTQHSKIFKANVKNHAHPDLSATIHAIAKACDSANVVDLKELLLILTPEYAIIK